MVYGHDKACGLKAIIAIHDSTLGPALGGCRMWNYASDERALRDVLRLSRGMTYKSALARLPLGGDKAVIIGDPHHGKSEALFQAMGDFVDSLGGRYVNAADLGTGVVEIRIMAERTRHVAGAGRREAFGGGSRIAIRRPRPPLGCLSASSRPWRIVWGVRILKVCEWPARVSARSASAWPSCCVAVRDQCWRHHQRLLRAQRWQRG